MKQDPVTIRILDAAAISSDDHTAAETLEVSRKMKVELRHKGSSNKNRTRHCFPRLRSTGNNWNNFGKLSTADVKMVQRKN